MKPNIPNTYEMVFEEKLEDLNGLGMVLTHRKTGARVALIQNEDDNKVFSIGFRTPPKNSTGVAHIIEHSVLCGSKNFPAKDPFIELAKGSLNTFLNAMTYPDKTLYPVASVNMQDFKNLMHVYMDAVLYPNIYQKEEIFQQEGWHYDLQDEEAPLKYNGVVYNEMKGVFSSPESLINRLIQNSLFPQSPYGVESGGDPDYIPDLSYEEFLDFHRTYYHPSNSYIYLYGNMDFEERLRWLDEQYLSCFDRLEVESEVVLQTGFSSMKEVNAFYSLGEEENPKDNTYLSYSTVIGQNLNREVGMAFQILEYVLLNAPGAPIKQALLDAGIGKDILGGFEDEIRQPLFMIIAKSSEESKKESFIQVIREVLSGLVAKGLDEKSLRAAINYYEFKYREADYGQFPKGLMYGLRVMSSWLYDDVKPFLQLKDNTGYAFLKEQIGTGYFESLIQQYLLDNTHSSMVILKPKAGLNAEKEEKLQEKLANHKKQLSKDEISRLIKATKQLSEYQEAPSTKEELETIPMLTREDMSRDIRPLFNQELNVDDIKIIYHDIFTNKIAYIELLFHLKAVPKELLPYLSLLSMVMGYVDTENYSYLELSNEININTGGISTNVKSFGQKGDTDLFYPVFAFNTKVLYDKLPEAFRLLEELIYCTKLEDKKRLKEIINEMKSKLQMHFKSAGHSVAVDRAASYYSKHGLFKEITTGIEFYQFIEKLLENFDTKADQIIHNLRILIQTIFTKERLMVSLTADVEGKDLFVEGLKTFGSKLAAQTDEALWETYGQEELLPIAHNEGFKAPIQVQFVARTGNFFRAGFDYTGALKVLRTILSYDYLWNNVRVKGGAYGCMCGFSGVDGDAYFTSYRDPNLKETNQVYEGISDYLESFTADERDMTKYMIGTFSTLDAPLTPQNNGKRSLSMYMAGITEQELQEERDEILNVTQDAIRGLASTVKSVLNAGYICVIGNENKVADNSELFQEVKNLIK